MAKLRPGTSVDSEDFHSRVLGDIITNRMKDILFELEGRPFDLRIIDAQAERTMHDATYSEVAKPDIAVVYYKDIINPLTSPQYPYSAALFEVKTAFSSNRGRPKNDSIRKLKTQLGILEHYIRTNRPVIETFLNQLDIPEVDVGKVPVRAVGIYRTKRGGIELYRYPKL